MNPLFLFFNEAFQNHTGLSLSCLTPNVSNLHLGELAPLFVCLPFTDCSLEIYLFSPVKSTLNTES